MEEAEDLLRTLHHVLQGNLIPIAGFEVIYDSRANTVTIIILTGRTKSSLISSRIKSFSRHVRQLTSSSFTKARRLLPTTYTYSTVKGSPITTQTSRPFSALVRLNEHESRAFLQRRRDRRQGAAAALGPWSVIGRGKFWTLFFSACHSSASPPKSWLPLPPPRPPSLSTVARASRAISQSL